MIHYGLSSRKRPPPSLTGGSTVFVSLDIVMKKFMHAIDKLIIAELQRINKAL